MLITSAAIAVTVFHWHSWLRWGFLLISLIFVYTTFANIVERPEGIKIAFAFIGLTVLSSLLSRALRATELRVSKVVSDDICEAFLSHDRDQVIRLISHRPDNQTREEYAALDAFARAAHNLSRNEQLLFLEIERSDSSEFEASLKITGVRVGPYKILRTRSPAVPNAIAAVLIYLRDVTGNSPHIYFSLVGRESSQTNVPLSFFGGRRCSSGHT